jgi:hypothetical protein
MARSLYLIWRKHILVCVKVMQHDEDLGAVFNNQHDHQACPPRVVCDVWMFARLLWIAWCPAWRTIEPSLVGKVNLPVSSEPGPSGHKGGKHSCTQIDERRIVPYRTVPCIPTSSRPPPLTLFRLLALLSTSLTYRLPPLKTTTTTVMASTPSSFWCSWHPFSLWCNTFLIIGPRQRH